MTLELYKIAKFNPSLRNFFQWIIMKRCVSNLVIMFVGMISPPLSITSQISWRTLELWPLFSQNCQN